MLDQRRHSVVYFYGNALCTGNAGTLSNLVFEFLTDHAEMFGKNKSCSATIRTFTHRDRGVRKFHPFVCLNDRGVAPLRNLAKENTGVSFPGKFEAFDTRYVVRQHDAASSCRNQYDTLLNGGDLFIRHCRIACAKTDQVLCELFDPGAAADPLIANLHIP